MSLLKVLSKQSPQLNSKINSLYDAVNHIKAGVFIVTCLEKNGSVGRNFILFMFFNPDNSNAHFGSHHASSESILCLQRK